MKGPERFLLPEEEDECGRPADEGLVSLLDGQACDGMSPEATDEATRWLASVAADLEDAWASRLH